MTSLQMPKVEKSIISNKEKIVTDISKIIKRDNILSHDDETKPYETDALAAYKQAPLVVVLPETVEQVSKILKYCDENKIKVVPNPYFAASAFEGQNTFSSGRGPREIQFRYLPSECTIRIYNIAGELVKTINHSSPLNSGTGRWDLLTEDNLSASYGMYVYHIVAPSIGEKIGKLAIVK